MRFEWDPIKALSNSQKHGVTFEDAATVFDDNDALCIYDPDHSDAEDQFILLGMSVTLRVLVVCHCYREGDEVIRIISARKATVSETEEYIRRK